MTALAPEAVGILHQLRAGVLLHALDRGFRRQPSRDGLAHAPRPAAVVGEHLHRFDDFLMLVVRHFIVDEQAVDVLPKPQEGLVQALELGGDVVGEEFENLGARIVERDMPKRQPVVQRCARQRDGSFPAVRGGYGRAPEVARRDHLRQHHRGGFEGLDFLVGVTALDLVLDGQHANRPAVAHHRHAEEGMVDLLARFRLVGVVGVLLSVGEVDRLAPIGDEADKALALLHAQGMDRLFAQAFRCEQLKAVVGKPDIDRTHLGNHVRGDDFDNIIQLGLRL